MKGFHWLAAAAVGLALLAALGLHWASRDYQFEPAGGLARPGEAAEDPPHMEAAPSQEAAARLSRLLRTTGSVEQGDVQVQALFLNPIENIAEDLLVFQLALNTHSVSLASFNIAGRAVVRDSRGRTISKGSTWKPLHNQDYHHIMGLLIVPNPQGKVARDAEWVSLILQGIPKVESREFRWERAKGS